MPPPRVRVDRAAARRLAQSREIMDELAAIGEEIRAGTGRPGDYEVQEWIGVNRDRVTVRTVDDNAARAREARDHRLIDGLGAVRRRG